MKQAIAVLHSPGYEAWTAELIDSIRTPYEVVVIGADIPHDPKTFMTGGLESVYRNTDLDEFVYLNSTMIIKDNDLFKVAFEQHKGKSLPIAPNYMMFLGKYRREILDQLTFPKVSSKAEDVLEGEVRFNRTYLDKEPVLPLCPDLIDTDVFEERHGRRNMKLTCPYLIKWKTTWSWDLAQQKR